MLINITTPVSMEIKKLTDLPKLRTFMENNNIRLNKSQIAREMGINRRTVNKYIQGYEKPQHRNKCSRIEKYYDIIQELLSSTTQMFHFRCHLYRYLQNNYNFNIPEDTFYHYLKTKPEFDKYFNKGKYSNSKTNPVIRYETSPGEQGQFDWKESIPFVLKDTGEIITINILVLILGHSRFRIYKPSLFMTQEALIHLLVESFEAIGGIPHVLITDNMKTVMDKARYEYRPGKVNAEFDTFVKDFGFKLMPCVAARPRTKGKVESQMKYLDEIRAYSGKLTLVELYELINQINTRVNNTLCQGSGKIPILAFEKEKSSLLPLPPESIRKHYKIKSEKVKVNTAGMINVKSCQYSVPCEYINEMVTYQIHDSNIYIYSNTKLIATHLLTQNKLNYNYNHYANVLSYKFAHKNSDEVRNIAKRNLEIIGGTYS